jgi:hypothetical protein
MDKAKTFSQKAKVWVYPGLAGWHFITLDKKLSSQIREKYKKGFVKIEATVGQSTWPTSLFPHKQSGSYLLCIKASIRKKEGILSDDEVKVQIKVL